MTDNEDRYAGNEEELTQVRSIIKKLNEEKPSTERKREVVVRADGTKVVRVTKKRKVMMSAVEKGRRRRKHYASILAFVFLLVVICVGFMAFRMASMSSSSYLVASQEELKARWGAETLQVEGAGVDGTSFHLTHLTATFPESSMLESVSLYGMEAKLDIMSFLVGKLRGDELQLERVEIVLRDGANMQMPLQQGESLWDFKRIDCKDFSVRFASGEEGPIMLKNASAYMYYPHVSKSLSVVMFNQGVLAIKGWKTVNISEAKIGVSTSGIEDFSIRGTTDVATDVPEQRRTTIAFAGKIAPGANFAGPYAVETENMSLADFTKGRFEELLTARTVSVSHGKISDRATITLAVESPEPIFQGEFHLKNICLSSFPALMSITEHIEPVKRRLYNPLSLHRGHVVLSAQDETLSLEIPSGGMVERDLATVRGKMTLTAANELSGEMSYGIPMLLARVEYPDGRPDPIFQQNGDWAILNTRIKGVGHRPEDDMAEVEARAAIARKDRPARIPFDQFDLDKFATQFGASQSTGSSSQGGEVQGGHQPLNQEPSPRSNPFETADDPFAPKTPF